ncbi:uncharacterized protein LY79DRAFT_383461 [Colletotrichum navitas]|uniref:Uncharacterized protein n=1 Tax=Colletotrichum navitas TaxID=681940 RepID=A0AAD8V7Q5_9PEZI|nr:uncharacterized protein LY79DRAFT_383461 [Colletotrichum navitas]KAK1597377.1 hypothetical protein LY79DRAFT_383461 [Colletotrichum navitas]
MLPEPTFTPMLQNDTVQGVVDVYCRAKFDTGRTRVIVIWPIKRFQRHGRPAPNRWTCSGSTMFHHRKLRTNQPQVYGKQGLAIFKDDPKEYGRISATRSAMVLAIDFLICNSGGWMLTFATDPRDVAPTTPEPNLVSQSRLSCSFEIDIVGGTGAGDEITFI